MKKIVIFTSLFLFATTLPLHAEVKMSEKTKKATAEALRWLAKKQNEDGSFTDGGYVHNTAITGWAMLAFMSQGHLPNQGLHGPEVAKAARFLMASQRPTDGYLVGARGGNMYCHGMATLALCELWGQTNDDDLKPVVKKAVELIVGCQSPDGGWRYNPTPSGSDISVTIMQVMALRSAKNAGLYVPDATLEGGTKERPKGALDYIEACYNEQQGGFTYQPRSGAAGFARTAAGTCVLFLSGKWDKIKKIGADGKPIEPKEGAKKTKDYSRAVKYLEAHFSDPSHFYYGHYYAAHSMHSVGGKEWEDWYKKLEDYFLPQQSPDGSWSATRNREVGPVYQTSIGVIVLSAPAHYLPIFQN